MGKGNERGKGEEDEGGTAIMVHLGTRSTLPTNEMESPPVTENPCSVERPCTGFARWLCPEAAAP